MHCTMGRGGNIVSLGKSLDSYPSGALARLCAFAQWVAGGNIVSLGSTGLEPATPTMSM